MIMNYDEYIKIVPKETVEFVNLVLKFFDYICKNWNIVIEDKNKNQSEIVIDHFETKIFAILLGVQYYQNPNDKVRIILDNCGLSEDFINSLEIERIKETEVNYNDVFNKTANVFCQCEYYENYMLLMPDEIIINVYTNKKYRVNQMDWIFKNNNWQEIFSKQYSMYAYEIFENKKIMLEEEVYKDLSYDVIAYLEKVASWFRWFERNDDKYNSEVIKTFGDTTVASLILAIYDVDNKIAKFFENLGINKSRVHSFFINCSTGNPDLSSSCAVIIRQFFDKYINDGSNKEMDRKNLKIENIIGNIFDRNFTNSLVLEKLLYKYEISITAFDDFKNKLQNFERFYEINQKQEKIKKFFGDTNQETIEFVEFVSKVHQIIKNNFDNGEITKKYINNESDISSLAFFISSYFIPNDFINYFKDNGIIKEKLMDKLNINISKAEIDKMECDIDLIVNNYNNIVFGYTSDKKEVNINTVLYSLGNLGKINSDCILKLIKDINSNLRFSNNFTNLIIDYNKTQEKLRQYQLEQKFFGDMNKDTINFIKRVSIFYQILENSDKTTQFSRDDLIEIAIYYAARNYNSEDLTFKFLNTLTKTKTDILYSSNTPDENMDVIYNYFGKYIFDGKNKDKKKCEITIKDIYTNIFNKSVNDSLALYQFLDNIGFDYDKFNNFDESFAEYEKNKQIEDVKDNIHNRSCCNYFENLSRIYNNLLNMAKNGNLVYDIDNDIENIKDSSRLLAMLLETNNDNEKVNQCLFLLNKRGVTIDNYLAYINVSKDDFYKFKMMEIDYLTIDKNFDEYKRNYLHIYWTIYDYLNDLFKKNDNRYRFENFIKYLGESPEIIDKEMETGEEVVVPLSREEQLNYLATMPINTLEYSLNSISSFGMELSDHSITIANEFVNIAMQENNNNRVLNIKDEIDKLMKKPGVFARKRPLNEMISHNKEVLDNLSKILEENETRMLEVIDHLSYLKKLIVIYGYRLNNYIAELKNKINNFEDLVQRNKQNILDFSDNDTIKQLLYDKLNDYKDALKISLNQYKTIDLILKKYLLNLSKTSTARNTKIPNLYIALSIRDSILLEQDSISDLNDINNLLNNIVQANNELLDRDIFKVEKSGKKNGITQNLSEEIQNLSEEINKVLEAENLMIQADTSETDIAKTLVKKTDI